MRIIFEKEDKKKKRITKNKFMRGALITVFITTVLFTGAVFVSTHLSGADHSVLIEWWFKAVIIEIGGLLLKKMFEKKDPPEEKETVTEEEE